MSRQEIGLSSISQQGCIQLANSKEEPSLPTFSATQPSVYFKKVSFPYHSKALALVLILFVFLSLNRTWQLIILDAAYKSIFL